jgi:hypothetical protein
MHAYGTKRCADARNKGKDAKEEKKMIQKFFR